MKKTIAVTMMLVSIMGLTQTSGQTSTMSWPHVQENSRGGSQSSTIRVKQGVKQISETPSVESEPSEAPVVPKQGQASQGITPWPADAVVRYGHHYYVFHESLTWKEAQKACKAKGGHLAVLNDMSKFGGGGFWWLPAVWVGFNKNFPEQDSGSSMSGSSS
ncbi:MAG: C-type lectin domain-containing protein, partial [Desulfuromonadales bacterium]|nr:C-type lectin domain-containing protein [Desulfuromonadales bacterium]